MSRFEDTVAAVDRRVPRRPRSDGPLREWILDILVRSTWICGRARELQLRVGTSGPPFVHLSRPASGQLFLIYGGLDAYVRGGSICGMGILPFLKESGLSGRNITWIRDPYFNNYAQGFGPEHPDVASVEAWHRQHLASMPHVREVYAIGYSSGGYGALLFGHLLMVKKVWAISPRTSVTEHDADADAKRSLRELLAVHNGTTDYEIWYAGRNHYDRVFADTIRDCPGVTLHPHARYGRTHFLVDKMVRSGEFQALLPPTLGVSLMSSSSVGDCAAGRESAPSEMETHRQTTASEPESRTPASEHGSG